MAICESGRTYNGMYKSSSSSFHLIWGFYVCSGGLHHDLSKRECVDIGAKKEESICDLKKFFSERFFLIVQ